MDPVQALSRHRETSAEVRSSVGELFDHLDDQRRLSSHMSRSSWKMGGGRMTIEADQDGGRKVGSRVRLVGRVLGFQLSVESVVVVREPPHRKVWETVGLPRLLVIGRYRMGFELKAEGNQSTLRVFIDYDLPERVPGRWLGAAFGDSYAAWCTKQMVDDAVNHFSRAATASPADTREGGP